MKLKRKTELRRILLDAKGSTQEWDIVWIFEDGDWRIYSQGTVCPSAVDSCRIDSFLYYSLRQGETDCNKSITRMFKEIEKGFNA